MSIGSSTTRKRQSRVLSEHAHTHARPGEQMGEESRVEWQKEEGRSAEGKGRKEKERRGRSIGRWETREGIVRTGRSMNILANGKSLTLD